MSDGKLKKGDVVKLKSGSPKMTVTAVGEGMVAGQIWTAWFDGGKQQSGNYPEEALELV